jgi:hypothetical protein
VPVVGAFKDRTSSSWVGKAKGFVAKATGYPSLAHAMKGTSDVVLEAVVGWMDFSSGRESFERWEYHAIEKGCDSHTRQSQQLSVEKRR